MAQYQHYIPQFLLRNFAHPYRPQKNKGTKTRRFEKHKHKNDKVLNVVDQASDEPQLLELPVSRSFAQDDMYKDFADTIRGKKDVEQEPSRLESWTTEILHKVKKAYENNEVSIWLTRVERNRLRKFLFITKYRGPRFYEKYFFGDPQDYKSEDMHLLMDYMAKNRITRPRHLWLQNLRAIMALDMDNGRGWATKTSESIFPAVAAMFIFHVQHSYMAFCTPSNQREEFILTGQCYSVFEGPTSEIYCTEAGEYHGNMRLCYHEFGPISPRLMIIHRSRTLPEPLEDMKLELKQSRHRMLEPSVAHFPRPEDAGSILADLSVAKATNSYTRI